MRKIVKFIYITLGLLFVILGFVGILIPILPTTPFLLLAAFFFARSSERFLHWLLTNPWFGKYIRNYRDGRGMTAMHKALTISLLWFTIGLTATLAVTSPWVRLLLLAIAAGVTTHLLRINTYQPGTD